MPKHKKKEEFALGKFLKFLREQKGLSLREVQKATGIPNAYLSQLETGDRRKIPSPQRLRKLADYYNVKIAQLLEKAGYYENDDIIETYEQKVEKAFLHAVNDPGFTRGSRIDPKKLPMDAKRFILELYAYHIKKKISSSPWKEIIKKKMEGK